MSLLFLAHILLRKSFDTNWNEIKRFHYSLFIFHFLLGCTFIEMLNCDNLTPAKVLSMYMHFFLTIYTMLAISLKKENKQILVINKILLRKYRHLKYLRSASVQLTGQITFCFLLNESALSRSISESFVKALHKS